MGRDSIEKRVMGGLTFKDVLHRVVFECSEYSARQIAEGVGVSYSMLCNASNPELEDFKLAARHIVPVSKMTNDYRLLDFMEASCGRVAFLLPELPRTMAGVDNLVAENVRLFGGALNSIGEALKDGVIDDIELKRIEVDLLDQVRKAMALLQVLKSLEEGA